MSGVSGIIIPTTVRGWLGSDPRSSGNIVENWRDLIWEEVFSREYSIGIRLTAHRAGVIKLDFTGYAPALVAEVERADFMEEAVRAIGERVRMMNALVLCIHGGFLEVEGLSDAGKRITHESLIHFDGVGNESGFDILRLPNPMRPETMPFQSFDPRSVEVAAERFDDVLTANSGEAVEMVALLNQAHASYREHDFSAAVVLAWTVCESVLHDKWSSYYQKQAAAGGFTLNREKRKTYERQMSAATIIEVLDLAGELTHTLCEKLHRARTARNLWLHRTKSVSIKEAGASIETASEILEEVLGLHLPISLGLGFHGPL